MKRFYKFLMPLVALVAMALPWNASAQLTTVVADGTTTNSYIPIYGLWADDYTRSQFIYPVSMLEDLTAGSQITSLTFYSSTASQNWGAATFDVKLGEVTETTLSSYLTYTATTVYSGAITISNNLMKGEISMAVTVSDAHYSLKIRDNGIGIEAKNLGKIYDPFFTTKTTGEAAGVGLYLCREIIQNHGGDISVASVQDEYTEFTITLPIPDKQ